MKKISKYSAEDGIEIHLFLHKIEDNEWKIIFEEIRQKHYPLRKLQLSWYYDYGASIKADFN